MAVKRAGRSHAKSPARKSASRKPARARRKAPAPRRSAAKAVRKPAAPARRAMVSLQEARIEVERRGRGKPLLLLQGEDTYEAGLPLLDALAKRYEVIMPWAPGFGRSTLPKSIRTIDDISYLYLDLLDRYDLKNVTVLGFSVGGWIAAEIATKSCARLSRVVLVDALGVKFGGKFDRDIEDIYFNGFAKVEALKFSDPARDPRVLSELDDAAAFSVARHREVTAKLCWHPYFHDPSLKYRLNRITVPTLVIWGADDGFVKTGYGRAYARRIKGARFKAIPRAGHLPHVEQPDAFWRVLQPFLR